MQMFKKNLFHQYTNIMGTLVMNVLDVLKQAVG